MRLALLISILWLELGCTGNIEGQLKGRPGIEPAECEDAGSIEPLGPDAGYDALSPTRLLRRMMLSLTGHSPTFEQYDAFLKASEAQRETLFDQTVDEALSSTRFYETSLDFGHNVLRTVEYSVGASGDAYQGNMSGNLEVCPAASNHPGAYYYWASLGVDGNKSLNLCFDKLEDGTDGAAASAQIEPWWAPGTRVTVVGAASREDVVSPSGSDCGALGRAGYYDPYLASGCSCGPNLVFCYPVRGLSGGNGSYANSQRRHAWEEPARLWAHLLWRDRPLSDIVLGNYSVGTNRLRALYVRFGRRNSAYKQTDSFDWFRHKAGDLADPLTTTPNDPNAWREFVTEDLTPQLLALSPNKTRSGSLNRTLQFDPRTTTEAIPGLPAAGVLTMLGSNASFTRERPRAARWLETFACRSFEPPAANLSFPQYEHDPATGGPCMHCHRTIDPAAVFFKRWDLETDSMVPWPFIPGTNGWRIDAERKRAQWPYAWTSLVRWRDTWSPNTVLTPLTRAQYDANPEAYLLDSMRPGEKLYGVASDGTAGPLGWAKMIVQSGEFDRCMTRRLYERYVGRTLDPATEGPYLEALSSQFAAQGRVVRPFIKTLMKLPEFRRGL